MLDFTILHGLGSSTTVYRAEGIAADGVKSVAFENAEGEFVSEAVVSGNLYSLNIPGPVAALVATDHSGKTIYSQRLDG